MSCECKEDSRRKYYRYYDTPDGCDIPKKIGVTTKYGIITGLIISTYDVLMYSRAIGLGNIMRRYSYHTVPLALMGATFAAVTNTLIHVRDSDDVYNYFGGGFACGPILAYYLGTYHAVLLGGIALGVIGMIKKEAITTGHCFFPKIPTHMGTVNGWRQDYTLLTDPRDSIIHTCGQKK